MYRKWVEISRKHLAENAQYCQSIISPNCKMLAVVKANAYGHGSAQCSKILLENGVDWLGVSSLGEGLILRENAITAPVLCLGIVPPENIPQAIDNNITLTVCDIDEAIAINKASFSEESTPLSPSMPGPPKSPLLAFRGGLREVPHCLPLRGRCPEGAEGAGGGSGQRKCDNVVKIHIKLDTGMNRLGFYAKADESKMLQTAKEIIQTSQMKNIEIEGIFTHFWGTEYADCKEQFDLFQKLLKMLKENGVDPKIKHCCNSNAALNFPEFHLDMCRFGEVLYGYNNPNVTPIMEFKTIIVEIKNIARSEGVGYDHTFIAKNPRKIAILPVGYADGYLSSLGNKASVCINGEIAPIVGSVCMDMIMVDITDTNAKIGDTVTLYGREGVTMKMIENWSGIANSREITCAVGRRVPRVYV